MFEKQGLPDYVKDIQMSGSCLAEMSSVRHGIVDIRLRIDPGDLIHRNFITVEINFIGLKKSFKVFLTKSDIDDILFNRINNSLLGNQDLTGVMWGFIRDGICDKFGVEIDEDLEEEESDMEEELERQKQSEALKEYLIKVRKRIQVVEVNPDKDNVNESNLISGFEGLKYSKQLILKILTFFKNDSTVFKKVNGWSLISKKEKRVRVYQEKLAAIRKEKRQKMKVIFRPKRLSTKLLLALGVGNHRAYREYRIIDYYYQRKPAITVTNSINTNDNDDSVSSLLLNNQPANLNLNRSSSLETPNFVSKKTFNLQINRNSSLLQIPEVSSYGPYKNSFRAKSENVISIDYSHRRKEKKRNKMKFLSVNTLYCAFIIKSEAEFYIFWINYRLGIDFNFSLAWKNQVEFDLKLLNLTTNELQSYSDDYTSIRSIRGIDFLGMEEEKKFENSILYSYPTLDDINMGKRWFENVCTLSRFRGIKFKKKFRGDGEDVRSFSSPLVSMRGLELSKFGSIFSESKLVSPKVEEEMGKFRYVSNQFGSCDGPGALMAMEHDNFSTKFYIKQELFSVLAKQNTEEEALEVQVYNYRSREIYYSVIKCKKEIEKILKISTYLRCNHSKNSTLKKAMIYYLLSFTKTKGWRKISFQGKKENIRLKEEKQNRSFYKSDRYTMRYSIMSGYENNSINTFFKTQKYYLRTYLANRRTVELNAKLIHNYHSFNSDQVAYVLLDVSYPNEKFKVYKLLLNHLDAKERYLTPLDQIWMDKFKMTDFLFKVSQSLVIENSGTYARLRLRRFKNAKSAKSIEGMNRILRVRKQFEGTELIKVTNHFKKFDLRKHIYKLELRIAKNVDQIGSGGRSAFSRSKVGKGRSKTSKKKLSFLSKKAFDTYNNPGLIADISLKRRPVLKDTIAEVEIIGKFVRKIHKKYTVITVLHHKLLQRITLEFYFTKSKRVYSVHIYNYDTKLWNEEFTKNIINLPKEVMYKIKASCISYDDYLAKVDLVASDYNQRVNHKNDSDNFFDIKDIPKSNKSSSNYVEIRIWGMILDKFDLVKSKNNFLLSIFNFNGILMENLHSGICSYKGKNSHWLGIYLNDRRINGRYFEPLRPIDVEVKGKLDVYIRLYDYKDNSRLIYKFDACSLFESNYKSLLILDDVIDRKWLNLNKMRQLALCLQDKITNVDFSELKFVMDQSFFKKKFDTFDMTMTSKIPKIGDELEKKDSTVKINAHNNLCLFLDPNYKTNSDILLSRSRFTSRPYRKLAVIFYNTIDKKLKIMIYNIDNSSSRKVEYPLSFIKEHIPYFMTMIRLRQYTRLGHRVMRSIKNQLIVIQNNKSD